LIANGFSVNERVSRITARISSGWRHVTESMPRPPLFDTAAASSGQVAFEIGAWMIGSSIPNKSQIEVLIMIFPQQRSCVTQERAA
jgi:hypothetical protein